MEPSTILEKISPLYNPIDKSWLIVPDIDNPYKTYLYDALITDDNTDGLDSMETSEMFNESTLEHSGEMDNVAIHFHQFICHEYNKKPNATSDINDNDNIDGEMPSFDQM